MHNLIFLGKCSKRNLSLKVVIFKLHYFEQNTP